MGQPRNHPVYHHLGFLLILRRVAGQIVQDEYLPPFVALVQSHQEAREDTGVHRYEVFAAA